MKKNIFTAILLILTVLSFSCSSASDELPGANIEKISNPNVNLELEDITSLGFKKNKTYKVKDLPEAKSAYYGFLKIPKTKESIDYELRFYENQEKALGIGVEWVEERIGKDAILTKVPMKKLGKPDDISNAVLFLVSDKSSYITGETIHVNGGLFMP